MNSLVVCESYHLDHTNLEERALHFQEAVKAQLEVLLKRAELDLKIPLLLSTQFHKQTVDRLQEWTLLILYVLVSQHQAGPLRGVPHG